MFGHETITAAFKKLAHEGELGHAYLFFGDAEIGKSLFARSLGNFLEHGKFEEPAGTLSDAFEVIPAEGKKSLGIDEVREVRRFLSQTPFSSHRRLAIINNAELLTNEAQSAMLKIVEEPPSHALIILITHDPSILFGPLRSRFTSIYFPRFSREKVRKILTERLGVSETKAHVIAEDSYGRIGRALRLSSGQAIRQTQSKLTANEIDVEAELETKILALRKEGVLRNSQKLARLIHKETEMKRFNLNPQLQKKAIEALCNTQL
ncbi:MAG: hypothetical protein Q7R98_00555 [Candidatus Jorgensenbacteria bacterium]|nr:hypothetical protein [Candidatus Jorgensenbacteria bacterium]